MQALRVVDVVDEPGEACPGILQVAILGETDFLGFEGREERLHGGVVSRLPPAAHAQH